MTTFGNIDATQRTGAHQHDVHSGEDDEYTWQVKAADHERFCRNGPTQ